MKIFTNKKIAKFFIILLLPSFALAVDVNFSASVPDTTPPSLVSVSSQTNGASYTSISVPNSIAGTAADNSTGLGLNSNSTTFTLSRASDGFYWSGLSWSSSAASLLTIHGSTAVNNIASWTSGSSLPNFIPDTYTIIATATDKNSNNLSSAPVTFKVVASASIPKPVITSPTNGLTIGDTTPRINGTGTPGLTIEVEIAGTGVKYTATVQSNGNWSLTLTNPLPQGQFTISATQTDGTTVSRADTVTFNIGVPLPIVLSPAENSTINDTTPTITGTGVPGATVTVRVDDTGQVYTAIVNSAGDWSLTITHPVTDGSHTIEVIQTVDGVNSGINFFDFTIGIPTLTITSPDQDLISNDSTPLITGTGVPGARVTLTIVETGDTYTTTVNQDGDWAISVDIFNDGEYTIQANQSINGLVSSTTQVVFRIGLPLPFITTPTEGELIGDTTPIVAGTGLPGSTIILKIIESGEEYSTIVDQQGNWIITITDPLSIGEQAIEVFQEYGEVVSGTATLNFVIVYVTPVTGFITNFPNSDKINYGLAYLVGLGTTALSALPPIFHLPIGLPVVTPIFNFFAWFMSWFEKRRKYGVVYDSVTRQPIKGATVRLIAVPETKFKVGDLVEAKITGKKGEYAFTVPEGTYRLEVIKPQYKFASSRGSVGYKGELIHTGKGSLHVDIPIDNLSPAVFTSFLKFKSIGKIINEFRIPIIITGTLVAIAFVIERGLRVDLIILGLYGFIWLFELFAFIQSRAVHKSPKFA